MTLVRRECFESVSSSMNIETERERNTFFSIVHGLVMTEKKLIGKKLFTILYWSLSVVYYLSGLAISRTACSRRRTRRGIFSTGETSLLLQCIDAEAVGQNDDNPAIRVQVDLSLPCTEYASETNKKKRDKVLKRKQRRMKTQYCSKKKREREKRKVRLYNRNRNDCFRML